MWDIITNLLAYLVKNLNMIVGIISALTKLICGLINIFAPSKDGLIDTIESISKKIQEVLHQISEGLGKSGKSTK